MRASGYFGRFLAAAAVLAFVAPGLFADDSATRPSSVIGTDQPGVFRVVNRMQEAVFKLDLTDEQKPKIQAIFDNARKQANDIFEQNQGLPARTRIANITPLLRSIREQLAQVLTPEQQNQLGQNFSQARTSLGAAQTPGGPFPRYQAIKSTVKQMYLTPDQRKQVDDLFADWDQQIQGLSSAAATGQNVQAQAQQLREQMRSSLEQILTPEQLLMLRGSLEQPATQKTIATSQPSHTTPPVTRPAVTAPPLARTPLPEIGAAAPDFHLSGLNGNSSSLESVKGQIVVMEFGSLSCPVFRQHVREMEKLKSEFGSHVHFMIVYTREAFPNDAAPVERNKDDEIYVDQPKEYSGRSALGKQARSQLQITIPIFIDTMDDQTVKAYGGFPNGVVIIGKDGKIAACDQWTNPDSLRVEIEAAVNQL